MRGAKPLPEIYRGRGGTGFRLAHEAFLAAFFDEIRRGVPITEAESKHLLHGRTRESLAAELQTYGRKLGLNLKIEAPLPTIPSPPPQPN
ncbi:MAG: hypothetical protein ABJF10_18325 [Chthoniobacter sp.]|uniref:hypothetical protein n=1 Tax=Chthoniobacter sp. TaxID=2510640 RepID=UPI0032AE0983